MRLFRILKLFWHTSLAAETEYRLNFAVTAVTSLGTFIGSLFTLSIIYRQNYQFEGWTWPQALLVMAMFSLLEGFSNCILMPNLGRIVRHVQEGTLDFILLKPMDAQLWLSTRNLAPWGLPSIVFGALLMMYAGHSLGLPWYHYLMSLIPVLLSMVILYSLWFILCTTTIWFTKIYNVAEVLRAMTEAGRYPITAYPTAYRFVLTFVVPIAFMTTVPAEAMLGRASFRFLIVQAILAAALFAVSRGFWRFALRSYTSASS